MQEAVADSIFHGRDLTDKERERVRQFLVRESDEDDTTEWWVVGTPPEGDRHDG